MWGQMQQAGTTEATALPIDCWIGERVRGRPALKV
jgi:hypothetical protein